MNTKIMTRILGWTTALLVIAAGLQNANAQVFELWTQQYNGPANNSDYGRAIAVDSDGNVYVTGSSSGGFATIKYSAAGDFLWEASYSGPGIAGAKAIALDPDGNVIVTGTQEDEDSDYATIKYNSGGRQLWVAIYDNGHNDHVEALAVDTDGNAYVSGESRRRFHLPDYATIKYNPWGMANWIVRYDGPFEETDRANDIAVDSDGNVYVTGESQGPGGDMDFATIKYNSLGIQQWVQRYNSPFDEGDYALVMDIDSDANVYVSGKSYDAGDYTDIVTLKYDTFGNLQWSARWDSEINERDLPYDIAVDSEGNVYVAGETDTFIGAGYKFDWVLIKYTPEGDQDWVERYDGAAGYNDIPYALAIDQDDHIYVTGYSTESVGGERNSDCATAKYDTEGDMEWIIYYDGPAGDDDEASDIVVDENDCVYVVGKSMGVGTGWDYVTIKYTQPRVFVDLVPYLDPIQIPGSGGVFGFFAFMTNSEPTPQTVTAWTDVIYPDGQTSGPLMGPATIALEPFATVGWQRYQNVPQSAPPGIYQYVAKVGTYPDDLQHFDSFEFEKLLQGEGDGVQDWLGWGDTFGEENNSEQSSKSSDFHLYTASPNPFNPVTTIRFGLPEDGHVRLSVYDISGRLVATLAEGWRNAGVHEVTFDASRLASGVYFYRIEAGGFISVKKMVLMK